MIGVEGNVRYNEYEGKWSTTINVSAFHFAGSTKHDTPIVPDGQKQETWDDTDDPF